MSKSQSTISYEEVLPFLKKYIVGIEGTRIIPITECDGYVLAEDIKCTRDIPGFNNSAMDGWTFNSKDIKDEPFTLVEIGSSFAGHPFEGTVSSGQCVHIMTGGYVPEGADTVVMLEQVTTDGKNITFPAGVKAGQNVRRRAEEFKKGDVCIKSGTKLHAPHINFLASLGIASVCVYRKLRIAYFSTGDELQQIGKPLGTGQIYDSNRYTIGAMIREAGFEPLDLGICKDNPECLKKIIKKAADCADAIITSGGVSVGSADYTRAAVEEIGELVPWKCLIKPGKPLAIGKVSDTYFFGLPGNPTAAQVTFYVIVRLALRLLSHEKPVGLNMLRAKLTCNVRKRVGHSEFQRAILSMNGDQPEVCLAGSQKTGAMASMINGNCFIYLDDEAGPAEPGKEVLVVPFFGVI